MLSKTRYLGVITVLSDSDPLIHKSARVGVGFVFPLQVGVGVDATECKVMYYSPTVRKHLGDDPDSTNKIKYNIIK